MPDGFVVFALGVVFLVGLAWYANRPSPMREALGEPEDLPLSREYVDAAFEFLRRDNLRTRWMITALIGLSVADLAKQFL